MDKRTANAINQKLVNLERNKAVRIPPGISSSSLRQLKAIRDKALTIADALEASETGQNKMHALIVCGLATMSAFDSHDNPTGQHMYIATDKGRELLARLDELELWTAPEPKRYKKRDATPAKLGIDHRP